MRLREWPVTRPCRHWALLTPVAALLLLGHTACGTQREGGPDIDSDGRPGDVAAGDGVTDARNERVTSDWVDGVLDWLEETSDVSAPGDLGDTLLRPDLDAADSAVPDAAPDGHEELPDNLDVLSDGPDDLSGDLEVVVDAWCDLLPDSDTCLDVVAETVDTGDLTEVEGQDLADQADQGDVTQGEPPQILSYELFGAPGLGLSAGVAVSTDVATSLVVYLRNTATGEEVAMAEVPQLALYHSTAILMMRPAVTYAVRVEVTNAIGLTSAQEKAWTTPQLPLGFPQVTTLVSSPGSMAPGLTLVSSINMFTGKSYVFIVDPSGNVVFYNDHLGGWIAYAGLGQVLGYPQPGGLCLGSLLGSTILCKMGTDYAVNHFHHSQTLTPEGTIAALGLEISQLAGCPAVQGKNLVGDVLVEYGLSGALIRKIPVMEALGGAFTCNEDFGDGFAAWDWVFPTMIPTYDRTHCNSVRIDPEDGNYVLSCLNVRAIAKLDRSSGELIWAIGAQGSVPLAQPGRWPRLHHSAVPGTDNRILVYDNKPMTPPYVARAVEYQLLLDSAGGVEGAQQIWEYSAEPAIPSDLAEHLGEVHYLENGNILIVDGRIDEFKGAGSGQQYDPNNSVRSIVTEVTYPVSEVVFKLEVASASESQYGFWTMSALRIDDLGATPP